MPLAGHCFHTVFGIVLCTMFSHIKSSTYIITLQVHNIRICKAPLYYSKPILRKVYGTVLSPSRLGKTESESCVYFVVLCSSSGIVLYSVKEGSPSCSSSSSVRVRIAIGRKERRERERAAFPPMGVKREGGRLKRERQLDRRLKGERKERERYRLNTAEERDGGKGNLGIFFVCRSVCLSVCLEHGCSPLGGV